MDFTQFVMFCIERNMVTNKNGLDVLYVTFKDACDKQFNHGLNHGLLDMNKFYYAMLQLARIYYSGEDRPFEAMFMRMLAADQGMGLDFKRKCARSSHLSGPSPEAPSRSRSPCPAGSSGPTS